MSESAESAQVGFASLGLDPRLTENLEYNDPSPIQREAIPVILEGKDVVGLAGTGTGKTAAFALPSIHRLVMQEKRRAGVAILVLTPTRELAMQVSKAIKAYGKPFKIEVLAVYGGTGYSDQIRSIRRGVDVVVATPGRALDLQRQNQLPLENVSTVILDEADEMLDMGFAEDIETLLSATPKERQTLLFSATMPPRIAEITHKHQRDPIRIQVAKVVQAEGEVAQVKQIAHLVRREHKLPTLARVLDVERPTSAIIFCRTRSDADELTEMLNQRGYKPQALHGGLSQEQRDRVMRHFRAGAADLLIATDIAARGLDISHLSHVINFDVPQQPEAYVHRIGRVGRAGRSGVAITIASAKDQQAIRQIERITKQSIEIAPVPTVKQLRSAQLRRTEQRLMEAIEKPEITDELRGLLGKLEKSHSTADIALAAIQMLREPTRQEDQTEIPSAVGGGSRDLRSAVRDRVPFEGGGRRESRDSRGPMGGGNRPPNRGMAKIYFGIGRDANVFPKDLVGAIAHEVGIPPKDLGNIELTDRFSLVEVPEEVAGYVVEAMQNTRIRGRRVTVRPDRPPRGGYAPPRPVRS